MTGGDCCGGASQSAGTGAEPRAARPARLRRRAEFVAAQAGERRRTKFFTLQIRKRPDADGPARFGLTVTKKTAALSVRRNRIRRRLREILRQGAALSASPGCDYVFVARLEALTASFSDLHTSIVAALAGKPVERRRKDRPSDL